MKIKHIKIQNYRNLGDLEVHLNDTINFIVGENNLGKSNFLNLLNILFTKRAFDKDDFLDKNNPIEVELTLKFDDCEKGNFDDLIDAENPNQIVIKAFQENFEENLKFKHLSSGENIPITKVRNINYVHYDSLRNPISEISFDKVRGAGNFLNHLIKKKMKDKNLIDNHLVNRENQEFTALLSDVNTTLQKIKSFKDHSITAQFETEIENLLTKLVLLKDIQDRGLDKIGYGVQFSMLIALSILEKLVFISQNRNFQAFDYEENNGPEVENKKAISLVLGLDEPEIHLHPYMQRALVKYLVSITENTDTGFGAILKEVFDFDKVIGQVIIVTHSPNVLFNDFKQVIRFYETNSNLFVKSGANSIMDLNNDQYKHYIKSFPYIREAFFSKFIVLVEGDSEIAAFAGFSDKMNINLDESGISIIQTSGKGTIPSLIEVLGKFGIGVIAIKDRDTRNNNGTVTLNLVSIELPVLTTTQIDFEDEIITKLLAANKEDILKNIIVEYDGSDNEIIMENILKPRNKIYQLVDETTINGNQKLNTIVQNTDINFRKLFYLSWFYKRKGVVVGRMIADSLTTDLIPRIYRYVIAKAVKLAKNQ